MFVKKLVEKASRKSIGVGGGGIHGLRAENVNPRLAFHYGIPSGSSSMACDPIQNILAIATSDGRIKLFGKDNTQALLQSEEAVPSKFLQFLENQGILLNINSKNHIEVWDINKKELCYMQIFNEEITSFAVMQQSCYMYVGDCHGDIYVMKFDQGQQKLINMQYKIPFAESHGAMGEVGNSTAVICILPQPMTESKRVLLIFEDGFMSLWGVQESKIVFSTGGNTQLSLIHEPKKAMAACWVCPFGSKVIVGYSNGEIFVWAIPLISDKRNGSAISRKDLHASPNIPLFKLNLGYKTDKVPIVSLRWVVGDGKTSRVYVCGFSELGSCSFQVILLNENSESRTIKLVLPLTEVCLAMEIISCFSDRTKYKQNVLVLLLKSGQLCLYSDAEIERYLLQCQSKSTPSLPNHFMVKIPFNDPSITAAKLYTGCSTSSGPMDEDQISLLSRYPCLLSIDNKEKDEKVSSTNFSGFTKTKNLYITGHHDGTINFWDASSPLFFLILSIKQQSEDSNTSSTFPVTALHFDVYSQVLVSGDQNGSVRIFTFKKDALEQTFSFLQAKQGSNYTIQNVKVKGAVRSFAINPESKHLAIGTDKGFVFVFDTEENAILYQKQFPSQLYTGVISLQFENCNHNGYEKNVLVVGMEDSSVLTLEEDTGNALSASGIHTKKPSKALLMQTLDASPDGSCTSGCQDASKENHLKETMPKQSLLLFCSENAVRLYSLSHAIQGTKKLYIKKTLSGTCCFASIVSNPSSDAGLLLLFLSGKIEIRSLPDLALLKETSLRGFAYATGKSSAIPGGVISASFEGELVMVNGDQEIFFFSVLLRKDIYRHLEYSSQVYKKEAVALQEGNSYAANAHKEKKKGIFSMVRDITGNKSKHSQEIDAEDLNASTEEELSAIFSTANFSLDAKSKNSSVENFEEDVELDIDDIDLEEDTKEKPKERNFAVLSKQKLGKKFLAIKGKLKPKTEEKVISPKVENEDEKASGAIDQIKKKYGYAVDNEASTGKIAESKLRENAKKLQGVSDRTTEMQNTAQSFSSMAKELLRTAQNEKRSS